MGAVCMPLFGVATAPTGGCISEPSSRGGWRDSGWAGVCCLFLCLRFGRMASLCCFFEFSLSTVGYTYSFLSSSLFLPIFRLLFGIPSSFGSLVASLLLRLPFSMFFFCFCFFADCCLSSLYWVGLLVEFLYNKRGKRRSLCGQSQKSCAQVGHKIPQVFRPIVSMLA